MAKGTGFISLLFNIASSHFCYPQQLDASIIVLPSLPYFLLCSILFFTTMLVKICGTCIMALWLLCKDCIVSRGTCSSIPCLKRFRLIVGVCILMSKYFVCSILSGLITRMFFVLFYIYSTVQWIEKEWIWSKLAKEFSTINSWACTLTEWYLFFIGARLLLTKYNSDYNKSQKTSIRKNICRSWKSPLFPNIFYYDPYWL